MASIIVWRRRLGAATAIASVLLALGACSKPAGTAGPGPTSTDSGQGQLGEGGTSTTPAATATQKTGGGGGGTQAPLYPSDAKTYGLEILKAIGNKDNARLAALADLNTVNYAQQYQNKNAQWTYTDCANGTTTSCHYYNQTGDIAMVGMITAKLGQAGAGNSVYLDQSTYPTDPSGYVSSFVSNWTGDNYARMVALSSTSIADHFRPLTKFGTYGGGFTPSAPHPCVTNASKTCVDVSATGGTQNLPTQHFIVDPAKISAGKPNGITGYEPQT